MNTDSAEENKPQSSPIKCYGCNRIINAGEPTIHSPNCSSADAAIQREAMANTLPPEPPPLPLHIKIAKAGLAFRNLIEEIPLGRERSLALTKVDEALMWSLVAFQE